MKRLATFILAITMVIVITACAKPAADLTDKEYVKNKGVLIVGITDFKPMDYKDDNGDWIGFDADMAKEFAKTLGIEVKFVEIEWDNKIFELNAKSIDCVWNGMTLTDEVVKSMECSNPYCNNAQVVVVPASVASSFQDKDSIESLKFAVEVGSAGEGVAKEAEFDIVSVQSQAAALMEVAAGTSDACIIDLLMAGSMIGEGTSYPDLAYTVALNSEEYGVGFRKESDLAQELNKFFAKMYADGAMMEYAKTYGVHESIIAQ